MDWELRLINLFEHVCKYYQMYQQENCLRISNNAVPRFSDEEVLCVYLYGLMEKRRTIQDSYDYICNHLKSWFPGLPSYGGVVQRLNRLAYVFPVMLDKLRDDFPQTLVMPDIRLLDSMPIVLAKGSRSQQAKVASELANKGYCSSQKMHYYGVKLHILGLKRWQRLPVIDYVGLTPASDHDLEVFRQIAPYLYGGQLFADKAYCDAFLHQTLQKEQHLKLNTPIKKQK